MPPIDDCDYFLLRAQRERAIAAVALDRGVAATHLRLAEEYERKAAALRDNPASTGRPED
jgi:hypothetical protein